jgi:hypothetical protein
LIRPHLDLLTFSRVDEEIVDVIAARGKNAADLPVTHGFRRFSLRGFKKVTGEWTLICLVWDLKRLAVLRPQEGK